MVTSKAKALAIIPKCSGSLSLIGSICIIKNIIQLKEKTLHHQLILGLSIFDSIASIVNVMSTWPTPSDQAEFIYGASGCTSTCTIQGFWNEVGNVGAPLYTAALCAQYFLFIHQNWKESDLRNHQIYFHIVPIIVALTMGIVGIPLKLFNNSGWLCWYAPYPKGCTKDGTCTRGELAGTFRWIHYGIIWSAIIFVTVGMIMIYRRVAQLEKKSLKRSMTDNSGRVTKFVAVQTFMYIFALYTTWFFTTLLRIFQTKFHKSPYPLLLLMAIFFPLQGFWNALIFFRPRWAKENHKQRSLKSLKKNSSMLNSTKAMNGSSKGMKVEEKDATFHVDATYLNDDTPGTSPAMKDEYEDDIPSV